MISSYTKWFYIIYFIISISYLGIGQCDYYDDFSSSGDWTQVGSLVEVTGGELQYINGAPDGTQRRVFKELNAPYTADDCWVMTLEFTPESVGSYQGQPFPGHMLFCLSETDQDPLHDCPDDNCTGYPIGTQDAILIEYYAKNPPDGDILFRIVVKDYTTKIVSDDISYDELGDIIYVELKKGCSRLILNLYADEDKQNQLGDGPVSLDIPDLSDLFYIQHGNLTSGYNLRHLTGILDNVCIESADFCADASGEELYDGCEGDGYSVEVNGTVYDESNPNGTELLYTEYGCDSTVTIDLDFKPNSFGNENYLGCEGDGYSVEVNGTIYNEANPSGTEVLTNSVGCDSTVVIDLVFLPSTTGEELYDGCEGDGYEVEVNGTTYNESNPTGTEILQNSYGCDSIVTINLNFFPDSYGTEDYEGCEGDGYQVVVNGNVYDENNPSGTEVLVNANGCDSIVTIDLVFHEKLSIDNADPLEKCDYDFDNMEIFDLTDLENIIVGGNTNVSVNWFEDNNCTIPINNPSSYLTGTTDVFVYLQDNDGEKCNSDTIIINLIVIDMPNPGEDNQIQICNTEFCIDFFDNLNGNPEPGGYWTDDDNSGIDLADPTCIDFTGIDQGLYHYTYTTQDVAGKCDELSAELTIDISVPGNPGEDGEDIFCEAPDYYIDLESYLGDDFDVGVWYNYDGIDISDPNHVDLEYQAPGIYYFYHEVDNYPCDYQEAVVTIEIVGLSNAGIDDTLKVCNSGSDTYGNLDNALGIHDQGGYWEDIDQSGVDLSSPTAVNFEGIERDTSHYLYIVSNDICPEDSAIITVIIEKPPFAGFDSGGSLCIGSTDTINLFSYLNQYEDSLGVWSQIGGEIVNISDPEKVIFSNNFVGIDSFIYVTSGKCGHDTAFVYIDITSSPNAGDDYNYVVCQNSIVNLFDSLRNYNLGGVWFDSNMDTIFNPYNVDIIDTNGYLFYYILAENGMCLGDTAVASISVVKSPKAGTGQDFSVCQNSMSSINLFNYLSEYSQSDGKWLDDTSGIIISPENYSFTNYDTGQYVLNYIVDGNNYCDGDTASLIVNIILAPNAGSDNSAVVCNSEINNTVNLDSLLGQHDSNGYWTNSSGIEIEDSTKIDFTGIAQGEYIFEYHIASNETCAADSAVIVVNVQSKVSAGNDKEISFCEGSNKIINIKDELKPDDNTDLIFEDIDSSSALNLINGQIDISLLSKGEYDFRIITGQNDFCGVDTALLTITIVEALSAGINNSIEICNSEEHINLDLLLGSHDSGGYWIDLDNSGVDILTSSGKDISFKDIDKGTYNFEYKIDAFGSCPESSAIITVVVNPITYSEYTKEICSDQSIVIGNHVYNLKNPVGIEIITNIYGCDSVVNINLIEKTFTQSIDISDENCFGFGKLMINSIENASLPVSVEISDFGSYKINNFPFVVDSLPAKDYVISLIDADGCDIDTGLVFTIEPFVPYSIDINVVLDDNKYLLDVVTDIKPKVIQWNPSSGLSCDNCLNPIATPKEDIEYIVEIADEEGCVVMDTVLLNGIIVENKEVSIDIPNVFTPDNDGYNDIFYVKSNVSGLKYSLAIYDRWGENIYFSNNLIVNDSEMGWNGLFKGKRVNPGVYVYVISVEYSDGSNKYFAGDVLLIH